MKKKVLIIGMEKSGVSAYNLLSKLNFDITCADDKQKNLFLKNKKISCYKNIQNFNFDIVIISPGIPLNHKLCTEVRKKNIKIISEVELALQNIKQKCIGITGTNGKTTVVLLIEHILNFFNKKAKAIGNIGFAASEYATQDRDKKEIAIIELSSFQLQTMESKSLDVAAITNITEDHIDIHKSFKEYYKIKLSIKNFLKEAGKFFFIKTTYLDFLENKKIKDIGTENCLLAFNILKEFNIDKEQFLKAIDSFKKPNHRIEFVKKINNISFYNDSKSTNIASTIYAVKNLQKPLILIVGGISKSNSFKLWIKYFYGKVKYIFAIGLASNNIYLDLKKDFFITIEKSLSEAVKKAFKIAKCGDNIVLSPGCASFDMFLNYEHRGDEFKKIVRSF